MKTIKSIFVAVLLVSTIACKNESKLVDTDPSCEELVSMAQGDLDIANARMSVLTSGRSGLTRERADLVEVRGGLGTSVSQTMLSDVNAQIEDFDQSISNQTDTIIEARNTLAQAILACPSADQARLQTLDTEGSDLVSELEKVEVAEETARETIDRINPMIIEVQEQIQALETEREEAVIAREEVASISETVETIVAERAAIDAAIVSIDEELQNAKRRLFQLSDTVSMAYLEAGMSAPTVAEVETRN